MVIFYCKISNETNKLHIKYLHLTIVSLVFLARSYIFFCLLPKGGLRWSEAEVFALLTAFLLPPSCLGGGCSFASWRLDIQFCQPTCKNSLLQAYAWRGRCIRIGVRRASWRTSRSPAASIYRRPYALWGVSITAVFSRGSRGRAFAWFDVASLLFLWLSIVRLVSLVLVQKILIVEIHLCWELIQVAIVLKDCLSCSKTNPVVEM